MIACLSGLPTAVQYARDSFAAVSIDSPPPDVKKILAPSSGTSSVTFAARASVGGDVKPS